MTDIEKAVSTYMALEAAASKTIEGQDVVALINRVAADFRIDPGELADAIIKETVAGGI